MLSQSGTVESENHRVSELQVQLLAGIEKAKNETTESRVQSLIRDAGHQDAAAYTSVRVYGCSSGQDEEHPRTAAEMIGRQLLLFARGAEVTLSGGSLKINSKATISGVRVAELKAAGGYTVVQLDANLGVVENTIASDKRLQTSISKTAALSSIIQSISQNVADVMSRNDKVNADHVNGFVILKKMELASNGNPPQCRYELEIYFDGK